MSRFAVVIAGALLVLACTGESSPTRPSATFDVPDFSFGTGSDPTGAPSDIDLSADRIIAALRQAEVDDRTDSHLLLPPSLRDFMRDQGYEPAVVKQGDAAIGTVCKILKEDAGQQLVVQVVDAVLARLKRAPTGEGFGLLVSAAGYGCAGYDTLLSTRIQLADGFAVPTAPPLVDVPIYERGTPIEITVDDQHVLTIRVEQVTCTDTAGLIRAKPGRRYIGANVTLTAVETREYDPASWRVVVDNQSIGPGLNFNPDWDPSLRSGTLLPGGSASGWMSFDVPRTAADWALVYLRTDPEDGALFQLRFKPCP